MTYTLTKRDVDKFGEALVKGEKSRHTVEKYTHDAGLLVSYLKGRQLSRELLLKFKNSLVEKYAPSSVNSIIAAINSFLKFAGLGELALKNLKIQRAMFTDESKELTREDYSRLIAKATERENTRLALMLQTICATGIRVSELVYITADAVIKGRADITCKGKSRFVFLPDDLRELLRDYMEKRGIQSGAVFVTRSGKAIDRSNIWREMKKLCGGAGVSEQKVFPHNLRHLFARTYYNAVKDLSRLADILGHSSVSTTRIYTIESGAVHAGQINSLGLVLTPKAEGTGENSARLIDTGGKV